MPNTLTVNYSKNLEKPDHINGDVYSRNLYHMHLECKGQLCQIIKPLFVNLLYFQQGGTPNVMCSIGIAHDLVGTDNNQIELFFVGNLTEAGIQPGFKCIVKGCYNYAIYYGGTFFFITILTPRDICTIKGKSVSYYIISFMAVWSL